MDKLMKSTETVVAAVREKVPFLNDSSEHEAGETAACSNRYVWSEKAKRFRDIESGRFVSREIALGRTALSQVVAPPASRQPRKTRRPKNQSAATSSTRQEVITPGVGESITLVARGETAAASSEEDEEDMRRMRAALVAHGYGTAKVIERLSDDVIKELAAEIDEADQQRSAAPQGTGGAAGPVATPPVVYGPKHEEMIFGPLESELATGGPAPELDMALLMKIDPELHRDYTAAYKSYVEAHAKAGGRADFGSLLYSVPVKSGWMQRMRDKLGGKLGKGAADMQAARDNFDAMSLKARRAVLAAYGEVVPLNRGDKRASLMALDISEAEAVQRAISEKRIEIGGKKNIVSKKLAWLGTIAIATAAGVGTALKDGRGWGDHHLGWLAAATLTGAAAGYGIAKASEEGGDNSPEGIERRVAAAREAVESNYRSRADETMENRAAVVDAIEYMTFTARDEKSKKLLGSAAVAGLVGGGVAAVSHLGTDWVSGIDFYNGEGVDLNPLDGNLDLDPRDTGTPAVDPTTIDQTPGVSETYHPLDTNHDGLVDGRDAPDRNDDGVVDHRDSYDELDTNHDGVVNSQDVQDGNNDGIIDRNDVPEEYHSLDTNHDGAVDTQDMPDNNNDKVIDYQDDRAENAQRGESEPEAIEPTVETGIPITIQVDSSFTQEFEELYPGLDAAESYGLYNHLVDRFGAEKIFEGDSIYRMSNGDWGLHPGSATMPTEVDSAAREWVATNCT